MRLLLAVSALACASMALMANHRGDGKMLQFTAWLGCALLGFAAWLAPAQLSDP